MATTSKDNPYKPGTASWKSFEKTIMDRQLFDIGQEYQDAKEVAEKRLKTATEQIRLQEEKGIWVDEILEFLDGDEPEYDEVLDGPVKIVDEVDWESLKDNSDPLNWNQIVAAHYQQHVQMAMNAQVLTPDQARRQYAIFKPVFKGTIVVPKFIPDAVERDSLFDKIATLQDYEFTEEEYYKGEVQVPIRTTLKISGYLSYSLDPLAASNQTYAVAEFYIRRKK